MGSNAQPVAICVLKQLQHCVENLPRGCIDQCKIPALRSATLVASVCPDNQPWWRLSTVSGRQRAHSSIAVIRQPVLRLFDSFVLSVQPRIDPEASKYSPQAGKHPPIYEKKRDTASLLLPVGE
jgi:hypothetical protein